MIVYHGSYMPIQKPKIITSEYGRDFGFGFYTTDIKEQAERWAIRTSNRRKQQIAYSQPNISTFFYDEAAATENLRIMSFDKPTLEWLEFIIACRSDINYKHDFDITIGNIADDTVGETILFVTNGVMRKEDAIERLKFQRINNQICFNTEKSLQYLSFIESKVIR